MRPSCRLVLASCAVFVISACLPGRFASRNFCYAAEPYTFGVVPQFEQRKLHAIWKPIIEELEKRTGLSFRLVSTLQIQDFEKGFVAGSFDFAYMNPYHLAKSARSAGYIPLVADSAPLRGILVVPRTSSITKLTELNGKPVAFPSPNALAASLLMRADLERLYHVTVKPLYVKSHSSVYLHVIQGLAVAGGGTEKTLQEQSQEIRNALRVIYTTRTMPSHPVAAHPRVPKEHREKVRQALLDMDKTPGGRELLSKVPVKQLVTAPIKDYSTLLDWGLDAYWDGFWREE
jgi:phosphonate transport system substrate-binding protein